MEKTRHPLPAIANSDFPVWHFPLDRPHAGVKLGNNRVGLLVWGGGRILNLSVGVPTLWDHDGGAEWREGQSYQAIRKVLEAGDEEGLSKIFPPGGKTPQLCPMGRVTLTLGRGRAFESAELDIRAGLLKVRISGPHGGVADIGVEFTRDQMRADPWSDPEKLWEHSPLRYADRAVTPTLFIHSFEDYRCPIDQGYQMFTALAEHGVETKMVLFRGENHDLSRTGKPSHRLRRLREITAWFDGHRR